MAYLVSSQLVFKQQDPKHDADLAVMQLCRICNMLQAAAWKPHQCTHAPRGMIASSSIADHL